MRPVIRNVLLVVTLFSALVLPWVVPALAALALSVWVPLAPFATGLLLDALYWAPHAAWLPWGTVLGALTTAAAYFVRTRITTRIIG